MRYEYGIYYNFEVKSRYLPETIAVMGLFEEKTSEFILIVRYQHGLEKKNAVSAFLSERKGIEEFELAIKDYVKYTDGRLKENKECKK